MVFRQNPLSFREILCEEEEKIPFCKHNKHKGFYWKRTTPTPNRFPFPTSSRPATVSSHHRWLPSSSRILPPLRSPPPTGSSLLRWRVSSGVSSSAWSVQPGGGAADPVGGRQRRQRAWAEHGAPPRQLRASPTGTPTSTRTDCLLDPSAVYVVPRLPVGARRVVLPTDDFAWRDHDAVSYINNQVYSKISPKPKNSPFDSPTALFQVFFFAGIVQLASWQQAVDGRLRPWGEAFASPSCGIIHENK